MTQDTRKDKRAKIVSLNVRYKSATVDEFIENHSHDVSKGGLFIKTPTPFPPGTLIKFEIRIAGDKAVIAGVGRVVWKREAGQAAGERPAGMGVKFIKIDDASRALIDRVVLEKSDAGRDFEGAGEGIVIGAEQSSPGDAETRPEAPAAFAARPQHKATMMGLGSVSVAPPPNRAPPPAAGGTAGGGMFPATDSIGDMPEKKERTVMKQAAELLEEALKEAGGSMDDIGSNPLFRAAPQASAPFAGEASPVLHPRQDAPKSTLIGMPAARDVPSSRVEVAGRIANLSSDALKREAGAAAAIAKSIPPEPTRDAPFPRSDSNAKVTSRQQRTDPPQARAHGRTSSSVVAIEEEPRPPKRAGGALVWVGLIVLAGGGAAYVYRDQLMGAASPPPANAPPPTASAPPPPSTIPPPSSATAMAPAATGNAAPTAESAMDASTSPAVADAGHGRSATPAPSAPPPPAPVIPVPRPAPPAPHVAPRATPTEAVPAPPPAAPKPKPKPASTDDDNPY